MSEKYALIIANTEYTDPSLAQLTAPSKDAKEFGRVLDSPEIGAFDDVIVLLNENVSKVSEAIDYFFADRKSDDLLVLYFSGHGVRDEYGALYLAVKNTSRARLQSTAIKSSFISELMDHSHSKRQILILDCCNSGAFAYGTKAETGGSVGTANAFEGNGYGRIVLTASDSTQFAWEGDKIIGETENSLFTHFLVKGLKGEADRDGDGRITIDELYDYTYEKIVNVTPKQTPGKWSYKQQGEIVLRQNIPLEDTQPVPLPADLIAAITNSLPYIREGAVSQLEVLLKGKNLSLARSARLALEKIANEDDSRRVAQAAMKVLEAVQPAGQKETQKTGASPTDLSTRTARLRREKMDQEIAFQAEKERLLKEKTELEKRLNDERSAREKAEAERKTKESIQRAATPNIQEPRPATSKSRFGPAWIWGAALLLIIGCGFAVTRFLAALSVPTATPTPVAAAETVEPIEATPPPTEPPTATEEPVETAQTGLEPEITDEKGAQMVLVQEGSFPMGYSKGDLDERPVHAVFLEPYYIDKYEVTNGFYKDCVNAGVCAPPVHSDSFTRSSYYGNSQYDQYPVIYVDWNMARAYCQWRGAQLPTEAQWEKAARGTDARLYPWGKEADCKKANYHGNGNACANGTSKVGSYESGKSPYNVYDMAGNVWEWVRDWYSETYYQISPEANPDGPDSGLAHVVRGGSWNRGESEIRTTNRLRFAPDYNNFDIGFRCARGVSQ